MGLHGVVVELAPRITAEFNSLIVHYKLEGNANLGAFVCCRLRTG